MNNVLIDGLLLNEKIDFVTVLLCLGTYFLLFWISICTWVYYDALKRYGNPNNALTAAVGVFILFFPGLIFYFAIRPHLPEHLEIDHFGGEEVNIPIINYAENSGVNLNLRISLQPLQAESMLSENDVELNLSLNQEKILVDAPQNTNLSYTGLAPVLFLKRSIQNIKDLFNSAGKSQGKTVNLVEGQISKKKLKKKKKHSH